MSRQAVAASSFRTSLLRYGRSKGLWVLLLVAPVAARFMIADRQAASGMITVGGHVPWLTSSMLGVTLGVVIATLLLPVAFIYLRANVNKRQPWQVEEVSAASRVGILYGRWAADVAILAAALAATTAAGCVLALLLLPWNEVNLLEVIGPLWVIAAAPLAMVASLRILFDARRMTRGPLGEVLFFVFWMASLVLVIAGEHKTGFAANMFDLPGFMSPLSYARGGEGDFTIGGAPVVAGSKPIVLDVMSGVLAPGYLPARLMWLVLAALVPLGAAAIYAPHVAGRTRRRPGWLKVLEPGRAKPANPAAPPARHARAPFPGAVLAEMRLIASGRLMMALMLATAIAGCTLPWAKAVGPAAMLLLVFGATAQAGRSEEPGLVALTRTGVVGPWARRLAFILAGALLVLLMGAPAILRAGIGGDGRPLLEALGLGVGVSAIAIGLAVVSRSATAPRLLLLILWYAYLNA